MAAAAAEVDERLMWVLAQRYNLPRHLAALRGYMLLGNGDFVSALMDLVRLPAFSFRYVSLLVFFRRLVVPPRGAAGIHAAGQRRLRVGTDGPGALNCITCAFLRLSAILSC